MERSIQMKEQNLKRKFANLEETMSRLKSQGAQLQAKLGGGGAGSFNFGGGG
jgi:flagellar hook-associated protein 2